MFPVSGAPIWLCLIHGRLSQCVEACLESYRWCCASLLPRVLAAYCGASTVGRALTGELVVCVSRCVFDDSLYPFLVV